MKKNITLFIKKHSILSYYAFTFLIAWGGFLAFVSFAGISGNLAHSMNNPMFLLALFTTILGPFLAGIIMKASVYGKKGLHDLFFGFFNWKIPARWYAVAIFTTPVTVFGSLLLLSSISPAFIPGILTASNKIAFVLPLLVISIISPIFEETGWTGFAIPALRKRYSILATGIIAGLLWGTWHGLSNLWLVGTSNESVPLALYMTVLLFSFLPPFRILTVWIYDHTKSLFLAYLTHVSLDFFWLIATPSGIQGRNIVIWYLSWAAILWLTVITVVVANHLRFSERPHHKLVI